MLTSYISHAANILSETTVYQRYGNCSWIFITTTKHTTKIDIPWCCSKLKPVDWNIRFSTETVIHLYLAQHSGSFCTARVTLSKLGNMDCPGIPCCDILHTKHTHTHTLSLSFCLFLSHIHSSRSPQIY